MSISEENLFSIDWYKKMDNNNNNNRITSGANTPNQFNFASSSSYVGGSTAHDVNLAQLLYYQSKYFENVFIL